DDAAARTLLEQALAIARKERNESTISLVLLSMARVEADRGNHVAAGAMFKEALMMEREVGARADLSDLLEHFAAVVLELAGPSQAARLWGAAERLRDEVGSPLEPAERPGHDRQVAAARTALGNDAAFDVAWSEGRAMSMDEAVKYALQLDTVGE